MKKIFLIILSYSFILFAQAQERFVARISSPPAAALSQFLKENYDIAAFDPGKYIDLVVDKDQYQLLTSQGFRMEITQTEAQLKANMVAGKALSGYRTYSDLYSELLALQTSHPGICKLYDIGESRGKEYSASAYNNYKHEIWALKVSDNVAVEEDEPCIYYMGEHHAREPISLEVAMYVLNYIVSNYGVDPSITNDVNTKQIWFVPLVNPNGHKIVLDEIDTWWRKNIRDNNSSNTINTGTTDGVDLNRNYGWEWGGEGTSSDPTDITYCGPTGFSEPETNAAKGLLDSHHFVTGISYHSYSELVLFPFGYLTDAIAPDQTSLQALAVSMANTIPAAGGGYYTPEKSSALYPASGITDDYAYGQHGTFAYTIELGTVFIPAASAIAGICADNLQAALILLHRVDKSTLTGLVKDAVTLLPVEAEIYIQGIDNTGSYRIPYKSDTGFGRYFRLLPDGNYTVTFSCFGYLPQTFNNVNINSLGQTLLNVSLVPAASTSVSGTITDLSTGMPISGATVELSGTPLAPVTTNAAGEYVFSSVPEGTYNLRVSAAGFTTVIQTVSVSSTTHIFNFQLQASTAWSFETGSFEPDWTFSGNAPWTISTELPYDGLYCSKSGVIGHSQATEMSVQLYITTAGTVSFFRKVSSESGYDYLKFYIDGVQQGQWSGTAAWGEVNYPVTTGLHTFKWTYSKDANTIGGSDCAWVDYIQFPAHGPIPGPANIGVSPAAFSKTTGIGGSVSDLLIITNSGEQDLTFTAQVEYQAAAGKSSATVYPLNAAYNTGTTTSSAFTQNSLVKGYPTTQAGWMKFDVSSIPDGSVISAVEFHGYVNATYYPYWNINPVTLDPLTATPSALYSDITAESSSGYYLYQSESSSYATGWKVHTLGGNANTNLQSALVQNWFTIGIMDRDGSSTYYIGFDGWNEANKPYLVVSYTYVPPYTWLSLNGGSSSSGTVTPGNSVQVPVAFNAGSLSAGTYTANIRISSNDPDQPQLLVPCTLTVSADHVLSVTLLPEGLYAGSGTLRKAQDENGDHFTGTTADLVNIELHDAANYSNIVYTATNVNLSTSGTVGLTVPAAHNGAYYITVKHRNSIETTSAMPVSFSSGTITYDFSSAASQAFGANMKAAGGKFLIYGGDVNQDGILDSGDMIDIDNDSNTFSSGYLLTDANGDGIIDSGDMIIVDNNTGSFVSAVTP